MPCDTCLDGKLTTFEAILCQEVEIATTKAFKLIAQMEKTQEVQVALASLAYLKVYADTGKTRKAREAYMEHIE